MTRPGFVQTDGFTHHEDLVYDLSQVRVGMGASFRVWTDVHACTVIAKQGNVVVLQRDHAHRTDNNGMSEDQSYLFEPNLEGTKYRVTLRVTKTARVWKQVGLKTKEPGGVAIIGRRREYEDPSF